MKPQGWTSGVESSPVPELREADDMYELRDADGEEGPPQEGYALSPDRLYITRHPVIFPAGEETFVLIAEGRERAWLSDLGYLDGRRAGTVATLTGKLRQGFLYAGAEVRLLRKHAARRFGVLY